MKHVRDLKIKTKEGFSIKNLKRFPSMEWGDEGGLQADVYYKDNFVGTLFQKGEGDCANMDFTTYGRNNIDMLKTAALSFVKRCDRNWNKYDWLRNKEPKDFDDDDWEALVDTIEERYDDVKAISKSFKAGYKSVVVISNDFNKQYLQYKCDGMTLGEVLGYMKSSGLDIKYPYYSELFVASMPEMLEVM